MPAVENLDGDDAAHFISVARVDGAGEVDELRVERRRAGIRAELRESGKRGEKEEEKDESGTAQRYFVRICRSSCGSTMSTFLMSGEFGKLILKFLYSATALSKLPC